MIDTIIFDIDGTLVDSNYQHTLAWHRAFLQYDLTVPLWRIHRAIGIGGDHLVANVTSHTVEANLGDQLRDAWTQHFDTLIDDIQPLDGAATVLRSAQDAGYLVAIASSGLPHHVEALLDRVDARRHIDACTTSADAQRTKPHPDLLHLALERVGGTSALLIGDSPWDCIAGTRAQIPVVGTRTGGFAAEELVKAGATQVIDELSELVPIFTHGLAALTWQQPDDAPRASHSTAAKQ